MRGIANDMHGMSQLMMANATPDRLCWLAPMLDVMGTETDWNPGGHWRPMSDADLLYRRALCKGKPFCFLMNTAFENFSHELVEKYMKRCSGLRHVSRVLQRTTRRRAITSRGPNSTSATATSSRNTCRFASAWPRPAGSRSRSPGRATSMSHVERFGEPPTRYLTVFNDSHQLQDRYHPLEDQPPQSSRELVTGKQVTWSGGKTELTLEGEDVALIQLGP